MRLGQTSIEYLLLTAGVILTAVVAGNYVVHSGVQVQHTTAVEANKIMTVHDTIPPTTTMMCNGTSCFTKYNESVKISFVCQDNLQGTGCKETHYQINGGAWNVCTQPNGCKNVATLTKPATGSKTYTVTFYSVDMNGNVEKKRTITITIGGSFSATHACSISFSPQFPKPGDTVQVTATASAKIYGAEIVVKTGSTTVAQKTCGDMLDGQSCSISFVPAKEGQYAVTVTAKDSFGNSGVCGSASINVDGTAPAVTFKSPDPCKWYGKDFTVNVGATDGPNPGSSLMNQWKYDVWDAKGHYTSGWLNIAPVQSTSESFNVKVGSGEWCSEQGKSVCNVQAEFKDRAGNAGTATEKYSIDYTPPTVTVNIPQAGWVSGSITVQLQCKDNISGCKYIHYKLIDALNPSNNKEGNLYFTTTSGCPPTGPLEGNKTLTITCPEGETCAYTLEAYGVDVAGNIGPLEKWSSNPNAPNGAYLIDNQKPRISVGIYATEDGSERGRLVYSNEWYSNKYGLQAGELITDTNEQFVYLNITYNDNGGSGVKTIKIQVDGLISGEPNAYVVACYPGPLSASSTATPATILNQSSPGANPFYVTVSPKSSTQDYAIHCKVQSDVSSGGIGAYRISATAEDVVGNTGSSLPDCSTTVSGICAGAPNTIFDMSVPKIQTASEKISGTTADSTCRWYKSLKISVPVVDPWASEYTISDASITDLEVKYFQQNGINISPAFEYAGTSTNLKYLGAVPQTVVVSEPGTGTTTYSGLVDMYQYKPPAGESGPGAGTLKISVSADSGKEFFFAGGADKSIITDIFDGAGNRGARQYIYLFGVDNKAPTVTDWAVSPTTLCTTGQIRIKLDAEDSGSGIYKVTISANGKTVTSKTYACDTTLYHGPKTVSYYAAITFQDLVNAGAVSVDTINDQGYATVSITATVEDFATNETTTETKTVTIYNPCTHSSCGTSITEATCNGKDGYYYTGSSEETETYCNPNSETCNPPSCGPYLVWKQEEYRDYYCAVDSTGTPECQYNVVSKTWEYNSTGSTACTANDPKTADQTTACTCSGTSLSCTTPSGYLGFVYCDNYNCTNSTESITYDCANYNAKMCLDNITTLTVNCSCNGGKCSCNGYKTTCPTGEYCVGGVCK